MSREILIDLINLTDLKINHLKKILEFTNYQTEVIKNEDIDKLDSYISLKQNEINSIDKIDDLFNQKFINLKKVNKIDRLEDLSSEFNDYLKRLKYNVSNIENLLNEIKKIEFDNNIILNKKFDEIKGKLKNLRTSKNVTNKYNAYKKNNYSIFIDSKK